MSVLAHVGGKWSNTTQALIWKHFCTHFDMIEVITHKAQDMTEGVKKCRGVGSGNQPNYNWNFDPPHFNRGIRLSRDNEYRSVVCPFSHDPLFIHLCHGVREGPSPLPHLGSRPRLIGSLVRKRLPLVIHYPSHITLSLVRLLCYLMCAKSPRTPVFLHRSSRIDPYQPL
ncbi:hypothetical protein QQF64_005491 [Cirrhinus molitorella]|uniref:Uncharacterized protein n=1 Tax=Cirrhinus molitorella TaxID=172907 RepID=A0ABR3MFQ5_9TELE